MELIDKATVVAEIEKQGTIQPQLSWFTDKLIQIINDSVEVKEVDLEKELNKEWNKCEPTDEGMGLEIASIEHKQFDNIAKHFFELGLKVQKGE